MKVLVLDSGTTVRKIISSFFPTEDCQIFEAGTAKEGLDLTFRENFDLITIGMILPDSDGFTVCTTIRNGLRDDKQNICKNSKIFLITSGDIETNRKKSVESGFDGIFPKPTGIEEFKTVIEEIIKLAYQPSSIETKKAGKILIIDDSELNLLLLGKILEKNGYSFQAFTEGKKAYEYLQSSNEVSYILTDWIMPDFSGEELVEAIRKQEKFNNIPIAVITGIEEKEDFKISIPQKNIYLLQKPYFERKILEYIRKV
ncbi:response regulator [Leptospira noguchii]|uniref:Response regulator receiver domain protein n=2 Tax=Leptospira noguchii TaxID=28182 RepID=T0GS29_9LEPT|nr:response regulator [Leptospira noguchii]EMO55586.1 response regulator receiver domain protein [Leptospira noguchii]EQA70166.1 response regulator receiver domain protein [Leptospira noguchii serovar Panama str. CZ214]